SEEVDLGASEVRAVSLPLSVAQPRLWWPAQLGPQNFYQAALRADVAGARSDTQATRFGIRAVTMDLDGTGARLLRINGQRLLVRGGGWASDMMLRPPSPARLDAELAYVRDLGLNAIRQEGKLATDEFYDRCDDFGILVLPGWMCCD